MHKREVARVCQQLKERGERPVSLEKGSVPNSCRENSYKSGCAKLPLGSLKRILKIDTKKRAATVEPGVTMEQLVAATLEHGLVPAVVPEFKSITVGGAVNGAALESSSHIHGQFNDICLAYEVLLGDGVVIYATPEENSDLFYGIAGSYGTFGVLLSVEIALVPAPGWVLLHYHRFDAPEKAVAFMGERSRAAEPPEYLEAVVFEKNLVVVIEGRPIAEAKIPKEAPRLSLSRPWSVWYYQHLLARSKSALFREALPLRDYLFRHDRNAFWMGGYALNPALLFLYILELTCGCPEWLHKKLLPKKVDCRKKAGSLFRALFGWMMGSKQLYRFMHHGTEKWFAENFCIQDYYLPEGRTAEFVRHVLKEFGISPVWLCPMRPTKKPQLFSPHRSGEGGLLFDVGVYGMAKKQHAARELDKLTPLLGGKKMLYSYSYYTPEEFWRIYPREEYRALRQKYFAEKTFPDITNKVL